MQNLTFRCPHCHVDVELSIENGASVIVLSCEHCKTRIMYYYGEAFEVDNNQMEHLQENQLRAVQGYMKVHGMQGAMPARATVKSSASHQAGQPVRDTAITNDDITDLLIDLQTTGDVGDFLKRIP